MIETKQIKAWQDDLAKADSVPKIEEIRLKVLGRRGVLTLALRALADEKPEYRAIKGKELNIARDALTRSLSAAKKRLDGQALDARLNQEIIDTTIPVVASRQGVLHPIRRVMEDVVSILTPLGFQVADGPDVEDEFHNFDALNIPVDHPARQMHDTFYLDCYAQDHASDCQPLPRSHNAAFERKALLLRTHTSSIQIRALLAAAQAGRGDEPIYILAPGRTYRSDSDTTHTPMFHQIEGLAIDRNLHMGHLKGCLKMFLSRFFNQKRLGTRFRPSFFPFTEPSAEVDIACHHASDGLKIGADALSAETWLEILGCGMVHPRVLTACGRDPGQWQGFAFGLGVERLAMLKYGIDDLRSFFRFNRQWLAHYGAMATRMDI